MALYASSAAASSSRAITSGTTEFDILKGAHRLLREDDDVDDRTLSWDDRLAKKYYASLYREYAVCDLKHYKSGNFAIRWRTEDEVLAGTGETTCGNTRCRLHTERFAGERAEVPRPGLSTLELPFAYEERGESKLALVKVVLCAKCVKKLMWKRSRDKERVEEQGGDGDTPEDVNDAVEDRPAREVDPRESGRHNGAEGKGRSTVRRWDRHGAGSPPSERRSEDQPSRPSRSRHCSRSRSPPPRRHEEHPARRRRRRRRSP